MKPLFVVLIVFLLVLQYQLWFGRDGLVSAWRMRHAVAEQKAQNDEFDKHTSELISEVGSLKKGGNAIENRARNDLGMVKRGETFYQVVKR